MQMHTETEQLTSRLHASRVRVKQQSAALTQIVVIAIIVTMAQLMIMKQL